MPVPKTNRGIEYAELSALFFLHAMAMGMWFVPLSTVLDAHGLQNIKAYAYATSGIAAFISPLIFGAMADRHASPVKVLRGLALGTGLTMLLACTAIQQRWSPWLVLAIIQVQALFFAPTWSISSTIVFARLRDSGRQFGPIRAVATLGWMAGCVLVSVMHADTTTLAGYSAALTWLLLAAFTFLLPAVAPPASAEGLTLRQRLGLDALTLLKNRDHRVVFITAALFSIPLAAFYPFTPPHLRALGLERTTAWMALGQVTEIIAMLGLAGLLARWRLKWIFAAGLGFGLLRYILCAGDGRMLVLTGVLLHGFAFSLVFITAQIYLDQRVDSAWRARAQALFALMTGGVGNLIGYLGTGGWFLACTRGDGMRWSLFWGGLAAVVAVVLVYFLATYRGKGTAGRSQT